MASLTEIKPLTSSECEHHARMAHELLAGIDVAQERLENMSPDDKLQMAATGQIRRLNLDLEWTRELAQAHALTALAIAAVTR